MKKKKLQTIASTGVKALEKFVGKELIGEPCVPPPTRRMLMFQMFYPGRLNYIPIVLHYLLILLCVSRNGLSHCTPGVVDHPANKTPLHKSSDCGNIKIPLVKTKVTIY